LIAPGKRRESLLTAAEKTFTGLLRVEFSAFESEAARPFSRIVVHRRALGRRSLSRMRRLHRLQE